MPPITIYLLIALSVFILLLFFFILFQFILYRGAPYTGTQPKDIQKMIALAKIKPGEKAADLGAGDGRIVIALAKTGIEAHGYEINPILVWLARRNIKKAGLSQKAFIHPKNFWRENLAQYNIITLFGIAFMMNELEKKLKKELHPGTRVISNYYKFKNWPVAGKKDEIYLYKSQPKKKV